MSVCNWYDCAYHLWSEGCRHLSSLQPFPVDAAEEGVALDLPLPYPRLAAQTSRRVLGKKLNTEGKMYVSR